jgi:hypothetical protein
MCRAAVKTAQNSHMQAQCGFGEFVNGMGKWDKNKNPSILKGWFFKMEGFLVVPGLERSDNCIVWYFN